MYEEKTGRESALKRKPKYDYTTQWYLEVFSMLSSSRSVGMGVGAIPFSEIVCYVKNFGSIEDDDKDFIYIIQAIDNAYLKEMK